MENVVHLVLRRMRRPLIVLITAYAISILGYTLIEGVDDQGRAWRMGFFHAFYVVSYMGSTIGFGELPYPFTDAQRLWTTLMIYLTVTAWLYAIGSLLTILRDQKFRRVLAQSRFARRAAALNEPFYLICGYGDTGSLIVHELAERGIGSTVVDIDEDRLHALELEDLPLYVPGLCADASGTDHLRSAGLDNPACRGVVAVTNDDTTNLKIALTVKLLRPDMKVIARAEHRDSAANMASFGTDHIINPFETFGNLFAMLFHSPAMHLVHEWITAIHDAPLEEFVTPPAGGWVLCGYGRFGKAVRRYLNFEGVDVRVIEADPASTNPPENSIIGRGTESHTLIEAGIREAVGIIAGTDDDTNNLSILITARDLNSYGLDLPAAFRDNADIFRTFDPDLLMQPSTITARRMLSLILTPLLADFFELAREQDEIWANLLVSRVTGVVTDRSPQTWEIRLDQEQAPAVTGLLDEGLEIRLQHLLTDPHQRDRQLRCVCLLHRHGSHRTLLPGEELVLQPDDRLLFCGNARVRSAMSFTCLNLNVLNFVVTGEDRPAGMVWAWLARRRAAARAG